MSTDLEQLLRDHIARTDAHIAAAAAWRHLMEASQDDPTRPALRKMWSWAETMLLELLNRP